jgi:hypothetical protein
MKENVRFLMAAALLVGCASPPAPPLAATHPASPDAPEGARSARHSSLRMDEATRKSRALLSAAQREQEKWDAYGPVSGTPEDAPKNSEPKHDHH